MIVTKIYLRPFGDESKDKQIGEIRIWNDGSGDEFIGNYFCELELTDTEKSVPVGKRKVRGFRRLEESIFELIFRCLHSARKGT